MMEVPLKVSGVDWLGEIPAHWEILRLKYIALQVTTKQVGKEEEHTYIGLEQIEGSTGRLLLNSLVDKVDSTTSVFIGGDILFGKLRPYLAKVVQPHFAGVCTTELLVLRPSKGTSNRFLFYQLLSEPLIKLVNSMTYGTKMPRVSTEQLTNITLPVPPLQEQRAIAAHLDRAAGDIDATISQVRSQIDLLREYRATLITSVVTGKVDVSSLL